MRGSDLAQGVDRASIERATQLVNALGAGNGAAVRSVLKDALEDETTSDVAFVLAAMCRTVVAEEASASNRPATHVVRRLRERMLRLHAEDDWATLKGEPRQAPAAGKPFKLTTGLIEQGDAMLAAFAARDSARLATLVVGATRQNPVEVMNTLLFLANHAISDAADLRGQEPLAYRRALASWVRQLVGQRGGRRG